jgi:hypothetical protein
MTAPAATPRPASKPSRTVESVLAHAHLRLGALSLARVELETMAGLGLLDSRGLVDLAEVRWRTGDLLGAGEAANAALREEDGAVIALVIAAEAASAVGRPSEARRMANRVLAGAPAMVDRIFAGMPRSSVWPGDSAEPPPTAPTLFDREPDLQPRVDGYAPRSEDRVATERVKEPSTAAPVMLGFWDGEADVEPAVMSGPDAAAELDAGRTALVAGALDQAALHFGLALRVAPALAPAVLEATEGARSAGISMVRGDAYRLAGHETSARQAYAVAARGGPPERRARARKKTDLTAVGPVVETPIGLDDEPAASPAQGGVAAPTLELDRAEAGGPVAAVAASDAADTTEAAEPADASDASDASDATDAAESARSAEIADGAEPTDAGAPEPTGTVAEPPAAAGEARPD